MSSISEIEKVIIENCFKHEEFPTKDDNRVSLITKLKYVHIEDNGEGWHLRFSPIGSRGSVNKKNLSDEKIIPII